MLRLAPREGIAAPMSPTMPRSLSKSTHDTVSLRADAAVATTAMYSSEWANHPRVRAGLRRPMRRVSVAAPASNQSLNCASVGSLALAFGQTIQ